MKRLLLFGLTLGLLAAPSWAATQAVKPAVIVSLGGIDRVSDIVNATHELNPQIPVGQWGAVKAMLAGIDQAKPWGVVVTLDGGQPVPLAFVPTEPKTLIALYKNFVPAAPKDLGDGVYELNLGPNGNAYLAGKGSWSFIAPNAETLKTLPADPDKLLEGLDKQYTLAVRVDLTRVPQEVREKLTSQLNQTLAMLAMNAGGGADQQKFFSTQVAELEKALEELGTATVGWSLDAKGPKKMLLDVVLAAKPGTDMARQFASGANTTSNFSGFYMPDAVFGFNTASKLSPAHVARNVDSLQELQTRLKAQLDKSPDFDDARRATANAAVGALFDVAISTVRTGQLDAGASLILVPQKSKLVAGGAVASGPAAEAAVRKLLELAKDDLHAELKPAGEYNGVKFQTFSVPGGRDGGGALVFGDKIDVYLGFGPKTAYLGVGTGAMDTVKQLIDQSAADASKTIPMARAQLGVGSIFKFASVVSAHPIIAMLQDELAKSKGLDHVRETVSGAGNTMTVRIELEEGLLRLLATAASFTQNAAGGNAPLPVPAP